MAKFPSIFYNYRTGDHIYFKTAEDFYSIKGRGRVTWVSEDREMMGIEFIDLDNESRKLLVGFLKMVF